MHVFVENRFRSIVHVDVVPMYFSIKNNGNKNGLIMYIRGETVIRARARQPDRQQPAEAKSGQQTTLEVT
jgi:hypothetical protein